MLTRLTAFVVSLWCYGSSAFGLDPNKPLAEFGLRVWQDGLPQNTVNAVVQTRDGYIWMGTYEGLVRFDGVSFTVFNRHNTHELPSQRITRLYEAHDGSLWIGTLDAELIRYRNGQFTVHSISDSLATDNYDAMCEDRNGNLIVGTTRGLYRVNGDHLVADVSFNLPNRRVFDLFADPDGSIWAGTPRGLYHIRAGSLECYTMTQGLADNHIRAIVKDQQGTLWVGTENGLCAYREGRFRTYTTKDGLPHNFIRTLLVDRQGTLWIGTIGGLGRLVTEQFESFAPNLLTSNLIYSLCEDHEGTLWVGTNGGGIQCVKDEKIVTFTNRHGLSLNNVRTLWGDPDATIWVGTEGGGLNRWQNGKITPIHNLKTGFPSDYVRCILRSRDGALWVGTVGNGLCRIQNGAIRTFTVKDGLPHNFITSILEDQSGVIWVGTAESGLCCFSNNTIRSFPKLAPGEMPNGTRVLLEGKDGTLWIGTGTSGLFRFRDGVLTNYQTTQGLSNNAILSLYEDTAETIWIGTGNGLSYLNGSTVHQISINDGLFDGAISQIFEDSHGNFWFGTSRGIFRVRKQDLLDFEQDRIQTIPKTGYGKADGMNNSQCNGGSQNAGWKSPDGKLWFATVGGLVRVDPDRLNSNPHPPPLVIEETEVDGRKLAAGQPMNLPPGADQVVFHYAAFSFLAPEKVFFKVKLEGYDPDWRDVGTMRSAYYTNLPPRSYLFRVKACNNDGVWNEMGAEIALTIAPRFYQTWWAYGLYVALGIGGIYVGGRYRLRTLRRRTQELEENIRTRTTELEVFQLALQKSLNLVTITDAEDCIVWVNDEFTKVTGYELAEIQGQPPALFLRGPETDPATIDELAIAGEARIGFEGEIYNYRRDGTGFWSHLSVTPIRTQAGEFRGFICIQTDISERKALERNLARFELAVRQTSNIVMITDAEDQIEWVNDGFTATTGYSLEEVRGWQPGSFLRGPETDVETIRHIAKQAQNRESFSCELYNYHKNGTGYWVAMTVNPIINREGGFEGFVAIQVDITARKRLETELEGTVKRLCDAQIEAFALACRAQESEQKALEASRAKSIFLANMSHELRTPLNAVLGFAQLMGRDRSLSAEHREHVEIIQRSGEHLLGLINDVLSISKIEAGKVSLIRGDFNFHRMLQGLEDMMQVRAVAKQLELLVVRETELPRFVTGDEGKLRQVLLNLLSNGVKFTLRGQVKLHLRWENGRARFEVSDTGPGIAPAELERLFEPFSQTETGQQAKEGTGLGLAISRTLVRLMNGDITVETTLGVGSVFRFEIDLPASEPTKMENSPRKVIYLEPGQPDFRILVVDDVTENRVLLSRLLVSVGFHVREAGDGAQAVSLWQTWQPHLIWMDIRMPVMDGYEATRQIRDLDAMFRLGKENQSPMTSQQLSENVDFETHSPSSAPPPNPIIIALTATAFEHDRQAVLEAGCNDFVAKPFQEQEIFDCLTRYLAVRFLYEERPETKITVEPRALVSERLTLVPRDLIRQLEQALVVGNARAATQTVGLIAAQDETVGREVGRMLKECRFDELLDLIEQIPHPKNVSPVTVSVVPGSPLNEG